MHYIKNIDKLIIHLTTESIYTYSEDALHNYLTNLEVQLSKELEHRGLYTKKD